MKKQFLFLLMIAIVIPFIFGCSCHDLVQTSPDMKNGFLIRHVNVFTAQADRPVLKDADVYIQGRKIARISTKRLDIPGAEIIDGKGRMLLPGLIDFHNHVMAGMTACGDSAGGPGDDGGSGSNGGDEDSGPGDLTNAASGDGDGDGDGDAMDASAADAGGTDAATDDGGQVGALVVSAPVADVSEAMFVCSWAESCLNPAVPGVHDASQPAPEPTMSRCVANYLIQAVKGVTYGGVDPRPFDVLGACAHVADACTDFKQCLFEQGVLNFCADATQPGPVCDGDIMRLPCNSTFGISRAVDCTAAGMHCVNGACEGGACTFGDPQTCSADGTFINNCGFSGKQANSDCHGQPCAMISAQARCLPAPVETACGADALTCDGDQVVACASGTGFHFDCADVGQGCNNGSCATAAGVRREPRRHLLRHHAHPVRTQHRAELRLRGRRRELRDVGQRQGRLRHRLISKSAAVALDLP